MPNQQSFYGWKLVAALWFLDFLNMGFPLYGGAVINTYMLKDIAMSRSTFGLGFTLAESTCWVAFDHRGDCRF